MNQLITKNITFDICKSGSFTESDDWVKVKGVASDDREPDLQGEIIKVAGIDTSYVGVSSYLKFEHSQSDPAAFIGTIDKADKQGSRLIIEGRIFKNTQQGRDVIELMKALKSVGRTIQMSIEGKVIQRNTQNPKVVEKSKFTHCALTFLPINRNTSLEFAKSENAEGHLFDHTDEETGKRVIVKKDMSIEVIDKAITTENMETKKEDLDKPKTLNKSEVIDYIFSKFETDIDKSEEIYNFINKVKQKLFPDMEGKEITEDVLKKAEEILEASKESQEIEKSETKSEEDKVEEVIEKSEEPAEVVAEVIEKAEKKEEAPEKKEEPKKEEEDENPFAKAMKMYKAMSDEDKEKMAQEISKMKKSDDEDEDDREEVEKSKMKKSEEDESFAKSFSDIVNQNTELKKMFAKAMSRIEKIEGKTIEKSVSDVAFHERFDKSENASPTLSMSQNRKELSELLLAKSSLGDGKVDDDILKSVSFYQTNGFLKSDVINKLKTVHGIEIVK